MSYVLRHHPESAGIELDSAGWTSLAALASALDVRRADIEQVARHSNKQRFTIEGGRIRANQGHSIPVDLGHSATAPPMLLYHGTVEQFLPSIQADGIHRGSRHHVHLSADVDTAVSVGSRRGQPIVLTVRAAAMAEAGHVFHRSANGVWLTENVPPEFVLLPQR